MKITPKPDQETRLMKRNEALAFLGLKHSYDNFDWLNNRWEGSIVWGLQPGWEKKAWRAYSTELLERLKIELKAQNRTL